LPTKILVIEDDPENRKLIEFILNEAGYVVVLAIDGLRRQSVNRQT